MGDSAEVSPAVLRTTISSTFLLKFCRALGLLILSVLPTTSSVSKLRGLWFPSVGHAFTVNLAAWSGQGQ